MQKLQYYVQSAGTAENIEFGFEPTKITVSNITKWASDGTKVKSYYFKGQPSGYSYNEITDDTATNRSISTSNGFTELAYSTGYITGVPKTISGASAASPCVITATAHGYTTGDKVRIRDIVGDMGTSLLNDNVYVITVLTVDTFSLQAQRGGANIDTSGLTYTSGGKAYNITESVTNENKYKFTLGTDVMGANDDILIIEAEASDYWSNLGDLA